MEDNSDWLRLSEENVLEPNLKICDPHHHFWEFRDDQTQSRYLLDDILADINSGHNIVSTVYIECGAMYKDTGREEMRPIGETEFVNGIAAMSASGNYGASRIASGIVGHANLLLGDSVIPVLEAQIAAGGTRFRGVRHSVPWDDSDDVPVIRGKRPPHLLMNKIYREGFAQLSKYGLSYEAWLYHPQIPELIDLANAFPDTTIILNHFGGPLGIGPYANKRKEVFEVWKKDISELAKCSNVFAKLGGINMEINGFSWHLSQKPPSSETLMEATRDWYNYTIDKFGVDRCLFESNFPVDKISCSYNVIWNSFKRLTKGYSESEKTLLYHDNASRIYRLNSSNL